VARGRGDAEDLASWRDGHATQAILEFVRSASKPGPGFVEPRDRIAALDNDGTLWCEKPWFVQADFLACRLREIADADPGLCDTQPYKAAGERDEAWLVDAYAPIERLIEDTCRAYVGFTPQEFQAAAHAFLDTARHPRLGMPYTRAAYRPMLELLGLLHAHHFRVWIVTACDEDFVSTVSEKLYGVPRESVIGSAPKLGQQRGGRLVRLAEAKLINDGRAKAASIWERIGRKPLLAVGNADGDVAMLETARHAVLLRHDDAAREFAYEDTARIALVAARKRGWTVVSMRNDFATVFDSD
jgi:phosphoserine phosphatase